MGVTLDKIAQRMAATAGRDWSKLDETRRDTWRDHALSILEPLLDPDDSMVAAGQKVVRQHLYGPPCRVVFTAMMRAVFEGEADSRR